MKDGSYYADGGKVFKRPIETKQPDGKTSVTLGFPVCKMSEYVGEEAAETVATLMNKADASLRVRPLDEWHEDLGAVLWWLFPVSEPPYAGTPLDDRWPGYHTHWTPIVVPEAP